MTDAILILGIFVATFTFFRLFKEATTELAHIRNDLNRMSYTLEPHRFPVAEQPTPIDYNRLSNAIESALLNAGVKLHNSGIEIDEGVAGWPNH